VCGGLFVLKGFEYDTESKQVIQVSSEVSDRRVRSFMNVRNATADTPILQIAFLQDGKPRMAFIAEKSPLLSMSMTEGVFSTFPKDEEIIKILRKWCDEHRDPEADRRLVIKNKSQISTMDANSLVRSSEGDSYRFSDVELFLKPHNLGIPATTASASARCSASAAIVSRTLGPRRPTGSRRRR
jgi:hypothetical protein